MGDPLDILLPPEGVTPGRWEKSSDDPFIYNQDGDPVASVNYSANAEVDAQHIATWDPDTASEAVALLRDLRHFQRLLLEYGGGATFIEADVSRKRLDALLARVAESRGE